MCDFETVLETPFFGRVVYVILVIGVIRMTAHSWTSEVGIGSKSHDLVGEDFRILRMSPSDTGSKEDRALLLMPGLVIETGADDCSAILIFFKELARSLGLT